MSPRVRFDFFRRSFIFFLKKKRKWILSSRGSDLHPLRRVIRMSEEGVILYGVVLKSK